jgi:HlyD family secretion protein
MTSLMMHAARALIALPSLVPSCQGLGTDAALDVLARDRVALTATANEIITDLPVAKGQAVTVGTVLVQLDDRLARANLDLVLANEAQAQADLERKRSGPREEEIEIARLRVEGARAVYSEAKSTVRGAQ